MSTDLQQLNQRERKPQQRNRQERNLLDNRVVSAVVRSRWYPMVFQIPVAAVFGLVAYQLLSGPATANDNAGTALMWVLWWPPVPVTFLLFGRFWCAVCPFATLSDLVQKLVGVNRPLPRFLKVYGIWIIDASFIAITWAGHVWGIVGSPCRIATNRHGDTRRARTVATPFVVTVLLFGLVNAVLFALPMAHRM